MKQLSKNEATMAAVLIFESYDKYDPFETLDVKLEAAMSVYESLRGGDAGWVMDNLRYSIEQADEDDDVSDLVDILEYLEEVTA